MADPAGEIESPWLQRTYARVFRVPGKVGFAISVFGFYVGLVASIATTFFAFKSGEYFRASLLSFSILAPCLLEASTAYSIETTTGAKNAKLTAMLALFQVLKIRDALDYFKGVTPKWHLLLMARMQNLTISVALSLAGNLPKLLSSGVNIDTEGLLLFVACFVAPASAAVGPQVFHKFEGPPPNLQNWRWWKVASKRQTLINYIFVTVLDASQIWFRLLLIAFCSVFSGYWSAFMCFLIAAGSYFAILNVGIAHMPMVTAPKRRLLSFTWAIVYGIYDLTWCDTSPAASYVIQSCFYIRVMQAVYGAGVIIQNWNAYSKLDPVTFWGYFSMMLASGAVYFTVYPFFNWYLMGKEQFAHYLKRDKFLLSWIEKGIAMKEKAIAEANNPHNAAPATTLSQAGQAQQTIVEV